MIMDLKSPLRETFAKNYIIYPSANACYALVYDDKGSKFWFNTGVCHGGLRAGNYNLPTGKLEYILSSVQPPGPPLVTTHTRESFKPFIHWLVNESPYADVFITKDPDDILKYGYVLRTDKPYDLVACALIASRLPTENYNRDLSIRYRLWEKFRELGFNGSESFVLSHVFNTEKVGKNLFPIIYNPLYSGHASLQPDFAKVEGLKRFLLGQPMTSRKTFKENRGYGEGLLKLWEVSDGTSLPAVLKRIPPPNTVMAKNFNIFKKVDKEVLLTLRNDKEVKYYGEKFLEVVYAS